MQLRWPKPNRKLGVLDAVGAVGLVGLLVARFVPVARLPFWGCSFRRLTGWPCPGCGLTRVADRFAHGHWAGAWQANPLGTVAALGFACAALLSAAHLAFGAPIPAVSFSGREAKVARTGFFVVLAANYAFLLVRTGLMRS